MSGVVCVLKRVGGVVCVLGDIVLGAVVCVSMYFVKE